MQSFSIIDSIEVCYISALIIYVSGMIYYVGYMEKNCDESMRSSTLGSAIIISSMIWFIILPLLLIYKFKKGKSNEQ